MVVYDDPFARWDGTRWLVESEMMLPFPVLFASDAVHGFRSHAFQVRAVVACDKDARLGRRRYEVRCEIEDVGLQATTQGRWRGEGEIAAIQDVLDGVDARLTGAVVQLQVDDGGALRNVDLEGVEVRNERERTNLEALRQVVARLMAGFHLQVPAGAQDAGIWQERDSLLLKMPSLTGVRGFTTIDHDLLEQDGHRVVRSVGQGTVSIEIPYVPRDRAPAALSTPEPIEPINKPPDEGLQRPPPQASMPGMSPAMPLKFAPPSEHVNLNEAIQPDYAVVAYEDVQVVDLEAVYAIRHEGVAVHEPSIGFVSERVWVVRGDATASSAGGVQTAPYWNTGRLKLLGRDDHPDVGPTTQVGIGVPELAPWQDMDLL